MSEHYRNWANANCDPDDDDNESPDIDFDQAERDEFAAQWEAEHDDPIEY